MLTVHIQRRLHARIRHHTESLTFCGQGPASCKPTKQWKQNAEPLQSQFLRYANFKHVDRFCSLKQLKLDKALRPRGAAKAGNAYASMSCRRLRSASRDGGLKSTRGGK